MKRTATGLIGMLLVSAIFLSRTPAYGQVATGGGTNADTPRWIEMMQSPDANFFEIQQAFNEYWAGRSTHRGDGYKPFKRWEYYWLFRVNPDGSFPEPGRIFREFGKYAAAQPAGLKSGKANWLELGPKTRVNVGGYVGLGRLNAIATHPTDTSIVYAGAPSGGLWKTTDGGRNWSVLTDGLPSLGVSSILVHPSKPDEILIGTGDRDHGDARGIGVMRTTDGGTTWAMHNNGMGYATVGMMERSPSNPDFILAATSGGIYKTTDGGANWVRKFFLANAHFKDLKFKPGNPNIAYATSTGVTGFFRTEDAGETWVQLPSEAGMPVRGRKVIGVSPAAPNLVYVICEDGPFLGCYTSQDDGKTFAMQSDSPNILGYATDGSDNGSQAWYDLCIAVDLVNPQIVFVGGINLWRSDNSGKTWKVLSSWNGQGATTVHADQHALYINPVNNRLYAGNDGGIYYTNTKGSSWKEISVGLGIGQIYRLGVSATHPDLTVTGFQDNGSANWTGTEWLTTGGGDGMESAVDPTDHHYTYTTLYYGTITQNQFNSDGRQVAGQGFGGIDEKGAWITPFLIDQENPGIMVAGYRNVWITHGLRGSSAISWRKITKDLSLSQDDYVLGLEQSTAQPGLLYVVHYHRIDGRNYGRLIRTEDFKAVNPAWISLTDNLPASGIPADLECHPFDPMTVYMALGSRVYQSADKGETWTDISGSLPGFAVNTLFFDESGREALYAGTDAGAYYRDAGMDDWVFFNDNLPVSVEVSELEAFHDPLDRSNSRLRASTFGRGLWETPLAETDPILPPTGLTFQKGSKRITLYWNAPFNPVYISGYRIIRNGAQYGTSTSPYYTDEQVEPNTDYTYEVEAVYANSAASAPSNRVLVNLADPIALPYLAGFEPGTEGWSSEKTINGWVRMQSDDSGIAGNTGYFYGITANAPTVNHRVQDILESPISDLSAFRGSLVGLTFDYAYLRSPDAGNLSVLYRIDGDTAWSALLNIDPRDTERWVWDSISVNLPERALSKGLRIGFRYTNSGSTFGGAGIDQIRLVSKALGTNAYGVIPDCRIYPNPSQGKFQLDLLLRQPGRVSVSVFGINGQLVAEESFESAAGPVVRKYSLEGYPAGVYTVRVQTTEGIWTDRLTFQ